MITPSKIFIYLCSWTIFVVYGSLIPFEQRVDSFEDALRIFQDIQYLDLGVVSRADWIANILLYIPLSYLLAWWLSTAMPRLFRSKLLTIPIVLSIGAGLAVAVEFGQIFFAPRTVSINDLIAESIGTVAGILLWACNHQRLARLASAVLIPGTTGLNSGLMLYALAYLLLMMFPFDFIMSMSELQWKLLQGNYGWGLDQCSSTSRCVGLWLAEVIIVIPLGLLLLHALGGQRLKHSTSLLLGLAFAASTEAAQFTIASGSSTAISVLSKTLGIYLGLRLHSLPSPSLLQYHASWVRRGLLLAILPYLIAVAIVNSWLQADWGNLDVLANNLDKQRYLPFFYHYFSTETAAVASLLSQVAIYLPLGLGFWLWHASGATPLRQPAAFGPILMVTVVASVIEGGKFFLPSSHPDFTNILIAIAAVRIGQLGSHWLAGCLRTHRIDHEQTHKPLQLQLPRPLLYAAAGIMLSIAAGGLLLIQKTSDYEATAMATVQRSMPHPSQLDSVTLPGFRLKHPRLPAPSQHDLLRLRQENKDYIQQRQHQANNGHGNLQDAIFSAYLNPQPELLARIHQRLVQLKPRSRGHDEAQQLALGYDWLHPHWNETQRHQLRDKLAHACNHVVNVIRSGKFSPYNATLYEGSAQALMACSIALYQDDERGDAIMAFNYELWKNRILPVWRQVMGTSGGWHEGTGIMEKGIGQALFKLPNMWRSATSEDLFATEAGLKGFLDFLVYRTRPDGKPLAMGDVTYTHFDTVDRRALALEYGHAAAYSLRRPPAKPSPSSWPWGPLDDSRLYNPQAKHALPLSKHFDGLGLIIMRSSWDANATYVTYKAGDNYSSFAHLDQGHFNIFKHQALAIDSGLYASYGSDHHLNYSYQTIAHNVATITNPEESAAIAGNEFDKTSRKLVNDGGQRRIGGNIEIYPHPMSVEEWQAKREVYHTGKILSYEDDCEVVTIRSDITAAYTNKFSGEGSSSARTQRVEQYLRTLVYDRSNDLVLIYDAIEKTEADYPSRWLLHLQNKPEIQNPQQVTIKHLLDAKRDKHVILDAQILRPYASDTQAVGGQGKEYWVEGKNRDNGGKAYSKDKNKNEAGRWRLEIKATAEKTSEVYLVALSLRDHPLALAPFVDCQQGDAHVQCQILGKVNRTLTLSAE